MARNRETKRILVEYDPGTFNILQEAKTRTGMSWSELVKNAVLDYAGIHVVLPQFQGAVDFTEDGEMRVDMVKVLAEALDIEEYYISWKRFMKERIARWKILRVESVLMAFAYHLAHADELPWYWDQTGTWLVQYLVEALREIGVTWKDVKATVEMITATIWGLYPWLWGRELASKVGRKVLERLQEKYPIKLRRATSSEDTRSTREIENIMQIMHYAHTHQLPPVKPTPLCIEEISVVAEWADEAGEHEYCYTFTD